MGFKRVAEVLQNAVSLKLSPACPLIETCRQAFKLGVGKVFDRVDKGSSEDKMDRGFW